MLVGADWILRRHLNKEEEVLWRGQPVVPQEIKAMVPVLYLLFLITCIFWGYALGQFYYIILPKNLGYNLNNPLLLEQAGETISYIKINFFAGLFFFVFWFLMKRTTRSRNHKVYAITSDRVLIIDHDADPQIVAEWGPGDVQDVEFKRRGDTGGDIFFAQESFGSAKDMKWVGFENSEDADEAFEILKSWIKTRNADTIRNRTLAFQIENFPTDWTAQTFNVEKGKRDNMLFSLLVNDILGKFRAIKRHTLKDSGWNTLLLIKRLKPTISATKSYHNYLKMIIEGGINDEKLPDGHVFFSKDDEIKSDLDVKDDEDVDITNLVSADDIFFKTMKRTMLVCELDHLFKELKSKRGRPRRLPVRINAQAKDPKVNEWRGFELDGSMEIMGTKFCFKQFYFYKEIEHLSRAVHVRMTFFCEEKFYEKHSGALVTVAKNLKIYLDEEHLGEQKRAAERVQAEKEKAEKAKAEKS